jgi:NTE family protein
MDDRPTFGIRLTNTSKERVTRFRAHDIITYALAMFMTATEAADERYIEAHDFIRTITINSRGISPINFDLTTRDKSLLYESGVEAAKDFLQTWNFDEWKKNYAQWAGIDRRALIWKYARKS